MIRRLLATLTMALLVVTGILATALAYEAIVAATARRTSLEESLRAYASVAAWEYSRRAAEAIRSHSDSLFAPLFVDAHGESLPAEDPLGTEPSRGASGGEWFRLERDTLTLAAGTASRSIDPQLNDLIRHRVREGLTHGGGRHVLLVRPEMPEPGTVLVTEFHLLPDHDPYIYGRILPERWLPGVLEASFETAQLVPPALATRPQLDSLLFLRVLDPGAGVLYTGGDAVPSPYMASDTIRALGERLTVELSLLPSAGGAFLPGGTESSRVPVLVFLLLLSLTLLLVSGLQMRREQRTVRDRLRFLAGVTHELRTPLTIVQMFSEMLLVDETATEKERRRWVSLINREAGRLGTFSANLRMYARTSAQPVDAPVDIDILALLEAQASRLRPFAEARGATIEVDAPAVRRRLPPDVIDTVLTNLLDNAIKYGAPDQTVTLRARCVDDGVRFEVEDQGVGVPRERRQEIWQPFVRLNDALRSGQGGSGVGLALVRKLVDSHGGDVHVEDVEGGGARFVVVIPSKDG